MQEGAAQKVRCVGLAQYPLFYGLVNLPALMRGLLLRRLALLFQFLQSNRRVEMDDAPHLARLQHIFGQHVRTAAIDVGVILLPQEDHIAGGVVASERWAACRWTKRNAGLARQQLERPVQQRLGGRARCLCGAIGQVEARRIHGIAHLGQEIGASRLSLRRNLVRRHIAQGSIQRRIVRHGQIGARQGDILQRRHGAGEHGHAHGQRIGQLGGQLIGGDRVVRVLQDHDGIGHVDEFGQAIPRLIGMQRQANVRIGRQRLVQCLVANASDDAQREPWVLHPTQRFGDIQQALVGARRSQEQDDAILRAIAELAARLVAIIAGRIEQRLVTRMAQHRTAETALQRDIGDGDIIGFREQRFAKARPQVAMRYGKARSVRFRCRQHFVPIGRCPVLDEGQFMIIDIDDHRAIIRLTNQMAQQQTRQAGLADMDDVAARVARHLRRPAQEARHIARRKAAHRQQGVGDWWPDAGPIGFKDRSHQFDAMIASGHIGEQEGATDRIMRHVPGYDAHPFGPFGQGRLVRQRATGMDGQGCNRQCPRSIGEIHRQQQRTTIDAPRRGKIANDSRSRYKSDRSLHQRLV